MTAIVATTRFGPMLVPPYDVYLSQAMIRLGEYAPAEFATWAPYIPEGGTVVDAGANIGAHTMAFAQAVGPRGTVHAFEPQRAIAYMLAGSVALCNASRIVKVHHAALSSTYQRVHIPPLDYAAQNNFGGFAMSHDPVDGGETVEATPLDTALNLDRLDFLKIDVEGMELHVLTGAMDTIDICRPVISAEADREAQVPALLGWLRNHGYRVWWHRPPLGPLWPGVVSINLLALPKEKTDLPEPTGDVVRAA